MSNRAIVYVLPNGHAVSVYDAEILPVFTKVKVDMNAPNGEVTEYYVDKIESDIRMYPSKNTQIVYIYLRR